MAPYVVLQAIAGPVVDRFGLRRSCVAGNAAATSPLVPRTAAFGAVPNERAAGMNSVAQRAGMLAGLPAAGVLIAAAGAPAVILADGVTFAIAAVLVTSLIPLAAVARPAAETETTETETTETEAVETETAEAAGTPLTGNPPWRTTGLFLVSAAWCFAVSGVGVTGVARMLRFPPALPVPGGGPRGRLFHDHGLLPANNAVNNP